MKSNDNDQFRLWYDQRDVGLLSKVIPFQSSVALSSVCKLTSNACLPISKHDMNIQRTIFQTFGAQCVNSTHMGHLDSNDIFEKLLIGLQPKDYDHYDITTVEHAINYCLQDNTLNDSACSTPKTSPKKSISKNELLPNNIQPKLHREIHHVAQSSSTEVKPSKFLSAKSQFSKEGGKLEDLGNTSSSSSSNKSNSSNNKSMGKVMASISKSSKSTGIGSQSSDTDKDDSLPAELQGYDKAIIDKIEADIIHTGQDVRFDDIAGLEFAKKCVNELICWPMMRPDLFQGLRALPKGLLLFGPPGTGKTLIGKAIACQVGATFFSISSSSLTSKWIGEGEKTVRTLFAVAAYRQPSVVFIDEVDSLLCQRSAEENEASRRMKTEFLVQLDGAGTNVSAQVTIIGATNRPDELDDAARRRFVKRIYIPLPDVAGRRQLFSTLLRDSKHDLRAEDLDRLVEGTAGYSGADIRSLCNEAALSPMREIAVLQGNNLKRIRIEDVPSIKRSHFDNALFSVKSSVSPADLQKYFDWNSTYGSFRIE